MKLRILYLLLLTGLKALSQSTYFIHPTTLQLFFSCSDFRRESFTDGLSDGNKGLGLNLTKGLQRHLDWKATVNFLYADSIMKDKVAFQEKQLLIAADASLRWRLLHPKHLFQPYLESGIGLTGFDNYLGVYLNEGIGLQVNVSKEVFVLLNFQKRFGLTNTIAHHDFYSIGLAGNIGRRKYKSPPAKKISTPVVNQSVSDRDMDGIVDSVDACPDEPGLKQFLGCPDKDQDGLPDNLDKCPTVPGFARYSGCPIPDRDLDGINDEEDSCVTVPGVLKYHGCPVPDRDSDGVNDEEDSCITESGLRELHGCPAIKKAVREAVNLAAKNIFFRTGSYELLPTSYPALDTVAGILVNYPELKIQIEGHTDNVGMTVANQRLSDNRARAILDYLTRKGINSSRLSATGFGEQKPIADNQTENGRALNRRVELKLH